MLLRGWDYTLRLSNQHGFMSRCHFPSMIKLNGFLVGNNKENVYERMKFEIPLKTYKWGVTFNSLIGIFSWFITVNKLMFVCLQLQMSLNIFYENHEIIFAVTLTHLGWLIVGLHFILFYEKYPLDLSDLYLKWLVITYRIFGNTENRISLRILDTAQWERCAAKFLSISANILLFGKSHFCL